MKNSRLITTLLVLAGYLAYPQTPQRFTTSPAEGASFSRERLQRLDAFLQRMIEDKLAPNVVTFVAHKGKVVHHKSFGYSDIVKKKPLKKDDIFRLASQSKAITSTALMILFEEGKFLLEDPISKYIPAFKNPQVLETYDKDTYKYTTHPAKSEITIRHLLTHTAGIPYGNPLPGHPKFSTLEFLPSISDQTLAQVIPLLGQRPLVADPGEKFIYGPNTDIVGHLIEILSGLNLADFLQKRIFEPLGMNDTYFFLPAAKAERLVELYSLENPGDPLSLHQVAAYRSYPLSKNRTLFLGGSGLVGTIEDYAKFCQMILNGGSFNGKQILSKKTLALMNQNQIGELEVWDRKDKFGLAYQIITDKSQYADLASEGSLTWGGMFSTEYTIDPKEELILLIYTNVDPYLYERELERKFRILVYQALK